MSLEAGVLFDMYGEAIHYFAPRTRTAVSLPDSEALWRIVWRWRDRVGGFAHSHPGYGYPEPSWQDLETFAAWEAALGRKLIWPIISRTHTNEYGAHMSRRAADCIDTALDCLFELSYPYPDGVYLGSRGDLHDQELLKVKDGDVHMFGSEERPSLRRFFDAERWGQGALHERLAAVSETVGPHESHETTIERICTAPALSRARVHAYELPRRGLDGWIKAAYRMGHVLDMYDGAELYAMFKASMET